MLIQLNVWCLLLLRRFGVGQCNIILAHNLTTITYILYTNYYFIILDGVLHGELIPLHLPSFSSFIRPLRQYELLFCIFKGIFIEINKTVMQL